MKILQVFGAIIYMGAILFVLFMIGRAEENFANSDFFWVLPIAIIVVYGGMFLLSRVNNSKKEKPIIRIGLTLLATFIVTVAVTIGYDLIQGIIAVLS